MKLSQRALLISKEREVPKSLMKNIMGKEFLLYVEFQPAVHIMDLSYKRNKRGKKYRAEKKQISQVTLHITQKNQIKSMEVASNSIDSYIPLSKEGEGVRIKQQSVSASRKREVRDRERN